MVTEVVTLRDYDLAITAEQVMGLRRLRHLPVIDENRRLVGLVTHRDLLRMSISSMQGGAWMENERLMSTVRAKAIMHENVQTTSPDTDLIEATRIIRQHKYGCLPVVEEDGTLVGIITEADFVRLIEALLTFVGDKHPEFLEELKGQVAAPDG